MADGQLSAVYRLHVADLDRLRSDYVAAQAAANAGKVSNLLAAARAIRDRELPRSANVARQTTSKVRALR